MCEKVRKTYLSFAQEVDAIIRLGDWAGVAFRVGIPLCLTAVGLLWFHLWYLAVGSGISGLMLIVFGEYCSSCQHALILRIRKRHDLSGGT